METIVLIGSNIAHSRSPRLHNHLFLRYNLPCRYELMPLAVEEVVPAVLRMKRGGYRGANVTSPHKLHVLPALDSLSDEARRIGAVNTIVIEDGRAIGHNTDAEGFGRSLADVPLLGAPFTASVIGTGGAAHAAIFTLLGYPHLRELTVYSRDPVRAADAAARWSDPRLHGRDLRSYTPADFVVHATPAGLAGDSGMAISPSLLRGTRLLYEMIYSPVETPLLLAARGEGIETISGTAMFVGQALAAFRLWTGLEPDPADVPADLFA